MYLHCIDILQPSCGIVDFQFEKTKCHQNEFIVIFIQLYVEFETETCDVTVV